MKLLVIGKTGQLATELVRRCPENVEIVALSRSELDLTKPDDCAAVIQQADADVIINAAAYTAVDKAESDEETAMIVNAVSPTRMAQVAAARNIPFLHVSTDYVYDGSGTGAFAPNARPGPLKCLWQDQAGRGYGHCGGRRPPMQSCAYPGFSQPMAAIS